jgi:hypothetical protein
MVVHSCNLSYSGLEDQRTTNLRPTQEKLGRSNFKNKRTGGVTKVVEHLLSKHEALDSTFKKPGMVRNIDHHDLSQFLTLICGL